MNNEDIDAKYALSLMSRLNFDYEECPGTDGRDAEYYFFSKGKESEHYSHDEIMYMRDCNLFQPLVWLNTHDANEFENPITVFLAQLDDDVFDANLSAAALIKLAKKAFGGLNLFFFSYRNTFSLGSVLNLELSENDGFALSNWYSSEVEDEFVDTFSAAYWWSDSSIGLYRNYIDAIRDNSALINSDTKFTTYDEYRDIDAYVDALIELKAEYGFTIADEVDRVRSPVSQNGDAEKSGMTYEEIIDQLAFIGSNQLSSYQLLMEAQDLQKKSEEKPKQMTLDFGEPDDSYDDFSDDLYDDPIEFAKYMERKKGIRDED